MAGTTTAICNSFKAELMKGQHNIDASGNSLLFSLIKVTPTGTYGASTTNAGTPGTGSPTTANLGTDEVASGGGYTTGGKAMSNTGVSLSTSTAIADFGNLSWTSATFSTTAGFLYNSTASNKAIALWDFGGTQSVSASTFTITMPTTGASTSLIRIA